MIRNNNPYISKIDPPDLSLATELLTHQCKIIQHYIWDQKGTEKMINYSIIYKVVSEKTKVKTGVILPKKIIEFHYNFLHCGKLQNINFKTQNKTRISNNM